MSGKQQKLIKEFMTISGTDKETAKHFLDACDYKLETAVAMFLDDKTDTGTSKSGASSTKATNDDDNVRAPIPQTSGVLVDDPHYVTTSRDRWTSRRRPRSVFDAFRDFKSETNQQEALLSTDPERSQRLKKLEDLFRPPLELMHKGTLETAREEGKKSSKWLMVNVQNVREFSCQVLNRDVWSKQSIQRLIRKHFIFWQVYNDSTEGDRFTTFYPVAKWPHISILDPRTGERLAVWNEINTNNFDGKVEEFLADHGTIDEDDDEPPTKRSKRDRSLIDDSEDTQLAAAIAASLKETTEKRPYTDDDEGFIISDENSYMSDFEASSEDLIDDSSDSKASIEKIPVSAPSENLKNGENGLLVETKINEDFFSETVKNDKNHQENLKKTDKSYKKMNSKLKVGTLDNGKDMSSLTSDIFGENSHKNATSDQTSNCSQKSAQNVVETPKDFCRILIRFPDGSREELKMEANMTVEHLSSELLQKQYPRNDYDLCTHFPKKNIYSLGMDVTLKDAGLYPRATVFVEEIET